ncbi:MAG: glycosyltransferase [Acidobacteria bacterium]|nr:glycosyltransferase [Acidobacteriota bacterium]
MNVPVTWLLPVKNGMPYLPETLASIEAQTYRNWQVLAWDNGSTDGTAAQLHEWIPSRLPGKVIDNNPLSLANSLVKLVEMAETEFCARIDADDVNYPERLERQVAFLTENPKVGIVGTDIEFIDENGSVYPGAWRQPPDDAEVRWSLRWKTSLNHPAVLFRRSVILAAGNYADCVPGEDHDLWLRSAAVTEIANIPSVLVKYRQSSTSFMAGWNRDYNWMFDKVAERNADSLFKNMSGAEALKLRRTAIPQDEGEVQPADIFKFYKAATDSALAVGKPAAYFRGTELYSEQMNNMRRRLLKQYKLVRAGAAIRRKIRFWMKSS